MPVEKGVRVNVSDDKATIATRVARAKSIKNLILTSQAYLNNPSLKAAADDLVAAGEALEAKADECAKRDDEAAVCRDERNVLTDNYDLKHGVLVKKALLHCSSAAELRAAGLETRELVVSGLEMPTKVEAEYDPATGLINVLVKFGRGRAKQCVVEVTLDPTNEASYRRIEGHGAKRAIPADKAGMWWIRVATQSASDRSAWFGPVSVYVKAV